MPNEWKNQIQIETRELCVLKKQKKKEPNQFLSFFCVNSDCVIELVFIYSFGKHQVCVCARRALIKRSFIGHSIDKNNNNNQKKKKKKMFFFF